MNLDWLAEGLLPLVAVKSLVLLSITWVVAVLLRRHSAAAAHRAWALGFVGCALLPLVTLLVPGWTLTAVATSEAVLSVAEYLPAGDMADSTPADSFPPQQVAEVPMTTAVAGDAPLGNAETPRAPASRATWGSEDALRGIWIAWGSIALLLTLRFAWQHVALWRLVERSCPLASDEWNQLLTEAAAMLRLKPSLELRTSTEISSPLCAGLVRPVILLPAGCDVWSLERRRLVLLHELAHVKRHDVLIHAFANLVAAVYWFNPLAWLGNVQMRRLREVASDDMVLNSGANSRDYAEVLVDVARSCRRGQFESAVAMARGSNVEQRVFAILDGHRRRLLLGRCAARAMGVGAAAVVLLTGSAQVVVQADPPEAGSAAPPATSTHQDGATPEVQKRENDTNAQLIAIAKQGWASFEAIESGHLKFRMTRGGGSFEPGLTPERCDKLLAKHNLLEGPEAFLDLIYDLTGTRREEGEPMPPDELKPWGEVDLQFVRKDDDVNIREAIASRGYTDVNIHNGEAASYWNDANSQFDVSYDRKDRRRRGIIHPVGFWQPLSTHRLLDSDTSISKEGDVIQIKRTKRGPYQASVNATTGFLLASEETGGVISAQQRWLEWTESAEGVKYPRVVATFVFRDGSLDRVNISVVTEARFNHPIPEATFRIEDWPMKRRYPPIPKRK